MSIEGGHRKQVRHYTEPGHCHELTFSCYCRMPLLTNDVWRSMLSVGINRAVHGHAFRLVAFVYMPEHVHLLVLPNHPSSSISGLLKAIKQPFSNRIKRLLMEFKPVATAVNRKRAAGQDCVSVLAGGSRLRPKSDHAEDGTNFHGLQPHEPRPSWTCRGGEPLALVQLSMVRRGWSISG